MSSLSSVMMYPGYTPKPNISNYLTVTLPRGDIKCVDIEHGLSIVVGTARKIIRKDDTVKQVTVHEPETDQVQATIKRGPYGHIIVKMIGDPRR
jgi:hypothetical protein